jgi:16S rRNA G1207 methylase RsmC
MTEKLNNHLNNDNTGNVVDVGIGLGYTSIATAIL